MDEEDGRPGPGARQSGPADVLPDAFMKSLCQGQSPQSNFVARAFKSLAAPSTHAILTHLSTHQGEGL